MEGGVAWGAFKYMKRIKVRYDDGTYSVHKYIGQDLEALVGTVYEEYTTRFDVSTGRLRGTIIVRTCVKVELL